MVLVVALRLLYRNACALVTWSSERFADTPKTQRGQGGAVPYRRQQW